MEDSPSQVWRVSVRRTFDNLRPRVSVRRTFDKYRFENPQTRKVLTQGALGMLPVGRTSVEAYVGIQGVYREKFGNHPGHLVGWFPSLQSDLRW